MAQFEYRIILKGKKDLNYALLKYLSDSFPEKFDK